MLFATCLKNFSKFSLQNMSLQRQFRIDFDDKDVTFTSNEWIAFNENIKQQPKDGNYIIREQNGKGTLYQMSHVTYDAQRLTKYVAIVTPWSMEQFCDGDIILVKDDAYRFSPDAKSFEKLSPLNLYIKIQHLQSVVDKLEKAVPEYQHTVDDAMKDSVTQEVSRRMKEFELNFNETFNEMFSVDSM